MEIAFIGMGGNLPSERGLPDVTLTAACARLGELGRVAARSSLYSTAPVGFADQPRFVNAVAALETGLSPFQLLGALMLIEKQFGRNRAASFTNGPRTLDLDILLYGDFVIGESALQIPHPRLRERAFVLVPLNEVAPDVRDPKTGRSAAELLRSLFPGSHDEIDAVVKLESDAWRADAGAGSSLRPGLK